MVGVWIHTLIKPFAKMSCKLPLNKRKVKFLFSGNFWFGGFQSEEPSKVEVFWDDHTNLTKQGNLPLSFDTTYYLERSEVRWRFLQSSVTFSEYMNFISIFVEKRMQCQLEKLSRNFFWIEIARKRKGRIEIESLHSNECKHGSCHPGFSFLGVMTKVRYFFMV